MTRYFKAQIRETNQISRTEYIPESEISGSGNGSGSSILHQATKILTDTEIKGSPTPATFPTILAAQGEDTIILLQSAYAIGNFTAGAYGDVDAGSYWYLAYGDDDKQATNPLPNDGSYFAFDGAITLTILLPGEYSVVGSSLFPATKNIPNFINAPIKFVAINGQNFTGGNQSNTLIISIAYYILNTTTGEFE